MHNYAPRLRDTSLPLSATIRKTCIACFSTLAALSLHHAELRAAPGDLLLTIPSPDEATPLFGKSVAGFDGKIVVGAGEDVDFSGKAYVFDATTGEELLLISNPAPSSIVRFAFDVASANEDFLVAGWDTNEGTVAYLYDGKTGNLKQRYCCGESGSRPTVAFNDGVVHLDGLLFNKESGELLSDLPERNGMGGSRLDSTAIGDYFAIGRSGSNEVYLVDHRTGEHVRTITNPTRDFGDFGYSVEGVGDLLAIGDIENDDRLGITSGFGAVYLIDPQSGETVHQFRSRWPARHDEFGFKVASDGRYLYVVGEEDSLPFGMEVLDATTGEWIDMISPPEDRVLRSFSLRRNGLGMVGSNVVLGHRSAPDGSVGGSVFVFEGYTIPEPSAGVLAGLFLLGIACLKCARK